jgi:RHS repeat-associated protein
VTDKVLSKDWDMDNIVDYFRSEIVNASDYTPFGVQMDGRKFVVDDYRYTFNGKEKDAETDLQDYGMRIYNERLGRFLSVDPLTNKFPMLTPYQFSSNRPIDCIDLDGLEAVYYSPYFQSRLGGTAILQLLSQSGLKQEIEQSFVEQVGLSTQKWDLYFIWMPSDQFGNLATYGETFSFKSLEELEMQGGYNSNYKGNVNESLKAQGLADEAAQSFKQGRNLAVVALNQTYLDQMTKFAGDNTKFNEIAADMSLTMYHEYKLHVEDNINGNKRSAIEDHKYGYGSDYIPEKYDWNKSSPSYDEIKDMSSVMGVAKGKIEYVFDQAKKQAAAQQQKEQEQQQQPEERK